MPRVVTPPLPADRVSARVSVLVFTLNEEINLPACLDSLGWSDDVVVVDSYSTDATVRICESRGIPVVQNVFTGFGDQRNFALENVDLKHDWVLILDADERVPGELADELSRVVRDDVPGIGAYRIRRRFHLWGKWLRHSSLYPTWVVRFVHRRKIRYVNRGHAETEYVDGDIGEIHSYLIDENLKGLDAWLNRQSEYARKDAEYELECETSGVNWGLLLGRDPMIRRAAMKRIAAGFPFRGLLYFLYSYVFRMGFLDGRDGLMFCRMKAMYQNMIVLRKHETRRTLREKRVKKVSTGG